MEGGYEVSMDVKKKAHGVGCVLALFHLFLPILPFNLPSSRPNTTTLGLHGTVDLSASLAEY